MYTLFTIIYYICLFILLSIWLRVYKSNKQIAITGMMTSLILLGVFVLISSFNKKESYPDYNYAMNQGQVVGGGSVISSHPEEAPGLGWVL